MKLTIGPLEVLALRCWLEGQGQREPMTETFRLTINTDNAAFGEDDGRRTPGARGAELARILRAVATHVEVESDGGAVFDVNGNRVGSYAFV